MPRVSTRATLRPTVAWLTLAVLLPLLALVAVPAYPASAATINVGMREYPYIFLDSNITINAGDSVFWRNTGGSIHDVTDDSPTPAWTSGNLVPYDPNEPMSFPISFYTRTFNTPGVYAYICSLHVSGGMRGTITVRAPAASATPSQTPSQTPNATSTPSATPSQSRTPTLTSTPTTPSVPPASPVPTAALTPTPLAAQSALLTQRVFVPQIFTGGAGSGQFPAPPLNGARWSDPATWGGRLPGAGDAVSIPAGVSVVLDTVTPPLTSVTVDGTLTFLDGAAPVLTANWVLVHGRFEIGSAERPFVGRATITLTGDGPRSNIADPGAKFLAARAGGVLEIHGARRSATSWTRLSATAGAGTNQLTVDDASGWQVGDQLVIAPTGYDPLEHERRTISAISGNRLTLSAPLSYQHFGARQTIDGRTVDTRAEVGLLSRNILIQGDSPGSRVDRDGYHYTRGFGGHVIVMVGGQARVEGVEFFRMGQTGLKGRYGGMHWHLVGEAAGDYIRDSSIHDSFHRGVVTHGTNNVMVERNVVYNVVSQAYMPAEDGVETGNAYICNLGVMVHQAAPEDFAFGPSGHGLAGQQEEHPGVFWTRNPNNPLRDNAAAGALRGVGFFYDGGKIAEQFAFSGNSAHTISAAGSSDAEILDLTNTRGIGLLVTSTVTGTQDLPGGAVFSGFTAAKNSVAGALLLRDRYRLSGAVLVDQATGALLGAAQVDTSLFIAQSANVSPDLSQPLFGAGGAVYLGAAPGVTVSATSFAGYSAARPALVFSGGTLAAGSVTGGLRFPATSQRIGFRAPLTTGAIGDSDGTLSGEPGPRRVAADPIPGAACVNRPLLVGYVCN